MTGGSTSWCVASPPTCRCRPTPTPGTLDAGYRGEIKVLLVNHDLREPAVFRRGDRIAQLVIQQVERAAFHEVDLLPGSARGEGGHGSTGGHAGAQPDREGVE
jgi:dUTP pyrophosphatase